MVRLLSPIWLVGLVALAVPLILHLWSRRPAQIVRVGSLRHLAGPPGPRAPGRRLEDLPLLLLRMTILAAVVLGLAGLALRAMMPLRPAETVVVVLPRTLQDSLAVFQHPVADSVRRAGGTLRVAEPRFPEIGTASAGTGAPGQLWPLISALDDSLPPGSRILLVGTPRISDLGTRRPVTQNQVTFVPVDGPDRPWSDIRSGLAPSLSDRPVAVLKLQVIADDTLAFEYRAAIAAWTAAIEMLGEGVADQQRQDSKEQMEKPVIVWLSGQSVSDDLLRRVESGGATLVEFIAGEPVAAAPGDGAALGVAFPEEGIRPAVTLRSGHISGVPLLVDPGGFPLVTGERAGNGWHFRVATRLDPDWSDLASSGDLAELALFTLRGPSTGVEQAPVHPMQATPRLEEGGSARDTATWHQALPLLTLLAGLLLMAERMVVYRRDAMAGPDATR